MTAPQEPSSDTAGKPSETSAPTTKSQEPSSDAAPKAMAPPPQWPPMVVDKFEPIRVLGVGGFGSVVLARKKNTSPEELVALKVAGTREASKQEQGYAHREIDILKELEHPNIMKVLDFWEPPPESRTCAAVMALNYCKGPTLENLLKHGGALSVVFSRVTCAQLVDALAYLHSRAVIHRDIKPDNLIVSGATAKQDAIWDNDKNDSNPDWKALRQKWRVTLVDFGFARALGPEDLQMEKITFNDDKKSSNKSEDSSIHSLNRSISRTFQRSMSALGNRSYAAPEIINGVRDNNSDNLEGSKHYAEITNTFSHHVSNYGMLADAFSLGNTIKYMMTGVPPNQSVNEMNSPLAKLCDFLCRPKQSSGGRTIQYRAVKDLPKEFQQLIKGTTHPSVAQRTSVRTARRYPILDEVLDDGGDNGEYSGFDINSHKIHFLHCTMKRKSPYKKKASEDDSSNNNSNDNINNSSGKPKEGLKQVAEQVVEDKPVDSEESSLAAKDEVVAYS